MTLPPLNSAQMDMSVEDQSQAPRGLVTVRRALISVSDKAGVVAFARRLAGFGVELISTGGTAQQLREAGLAVTDVSDVTGFPEMMDGRVKTLHPSIHGGLLGRRDLPAHMQAMKTHGIAPIDLVCINLYPFEQTIQRQGLNEEEAIEQIDIGGPAMIRSAAKNHQFVVVVTDPSQYEHVVQELDAQDGATRESLRRDLACAAFSRTSQYDTAIAGWMLRRDEDELFPRHLQLREERLFVLRYGENPHQKAAVYRDPDAAGANVIGARLLHGKALSYNNLNDAAAALGLVQDLHAASPGRAAAAIIKHTNACGAAVGSDVEAAFTDAWSGDPIAAFGGIVASSRRIGRAAAVAMAEGQRFFEVIIAPAFETEALDVLRQRWKSVRLLETGEFRDEAGKLEFRSIPGGILAQERDLTISHPCQWTHAAGPAPDEAMLESASFAWTVCKHLKSNAVAIGRGGMLVGVGCGQVDRVTACRLAVEKWRSRSPLSSSTAREMTVAASDAFFPFPDGPEVLINAGVRCIVHPGGSKRDQETTDLCQQRGVTCLLTGVRHFRH